LKKAISVHVNSVFEMNSLATKKAVKLSLTQKAALLNPPHLSVQMAAHNAVKQEGRCFDAKLD
jgi:hypothetical protein